ncbi:MAG: VTT domain-containing protein [Clostridiales Family XIII bacterium]|jgi:uncharacterized membrane protein YdjX (TVP38/TMEM64 family)|nr:VTT domain-containing protein [Clostridiales Family XIII bacterium]
MDRPDRKKLEKIIAIAKLLALVGIVAGIPLLVWLRYPGIIEDLSSLEAVNALLARHRAGSAAFFLGLQIFQVLVSVIPGQAIQIAIGYAYGIGSGYLLALAGIGAGTAVTYFVARALGRDAMSLIFGEERFGRFVDALNGRRAFIALFVVFLIPGLPKDLFAYAAGLSSMRPALFIGVSLAARSPALLASLAFGEMARDGSYAGMIALAAAAAALCILGLRFRGRLLAALEALYCRFAGR